jgi:hypothetical protein
MTTSKQVDSLAHYKQYCFFNKTRKHCCIIGKTSTLEGTSSKILQFGIARKGLRQSGFSSAAHNLLADIGKWARPRMAVQKYRIGDS